MLVNFDLYVCVKFIFIFFYNLECLYGIYSKNCFEDCFLGKYGLLCEGICNCDVKKCDKVVGCLKKGKFYF